MRRVQTLIVLLFLVLLAVASCTTAPGSYYASDFQGTADAALRAAAWQETSMAATSQAPIVRITETSAAIAVMATQAQSTSIAGIQTQGAAATGTANSIIATATIAQLNAQGTAIANNIRRDSLALQRQEDNNAFIAEMGQVAPMLALVLTAGGLLLAYTVIVRKQQFQTAEVDERGNVKPILNVRDGTYTDPDRNPNYRGAISDDLLKEFMLWMLQKRFGFNPPMPQITAARQDAATERDQMIDLATRGLPAGSAEQRDMKKLAGQQMAKQLTDSNLQSRFRILDDEAIETGVIDAQIIQVLDNDWKEAKKG